MPEEVPLEEQEAAPLRQVQEPVLEPAPAGREDRNVKHFAGIFERTRRGTYALYVDGSYLRLVDELELAEIEQSIRLERDEDYREVNFV